jgi:hypothetical protein
MLARTIFSPRLTKGVPMFVESEAMFPAGLGGGESSVLDLEGLDLIALVFPQNWGTDPVGFGRNTTSIEGAYDTVYSSLDATSSVQCDAYPGRLVVLDPLAHAAANSARYLQLLASSTAQVNRTITCILREV